MMNLWELAMPQWLLVFGLGYVWINLYVEIEDVIAEGLRRTERCEQYCRLQGLRRVEKLHRKIFL